MSCPNGLNGLGGPSRSLTVDSTACSRSDERAGLANLTTSKALFCRFISIAAWDSIAYSTCSFSALELPQVLLHQVQQGANTRWKGLLGTAHNPTQFLKDHAMPPTGGFMIVKQYRVVVKTAGGLGLR